MLVKRISTFELALLYLASISKFSSANKNEPWTFKGDEIGIKNVTRIYVDVLMADKMVRKASQKTVKATLLLLSTKKYL